MDQSTYFPILLDLKGRSCVVVGGGEVASRKVTALLEAGAVVKVISPTVTSLLARLAAEGRIQHQSEAYSPGDLRGAFLVIAATDDEEVNRLVNREAEERSQLINVVDVPELSSFIFPSVLRRGALTVAVSTGGASPALAAGLRRRLEGILGQEYALYLDLLARARRYILEHWEKDERRRQVLLSLGRSDLLPFLQRGDIKGALAEIDRITGQEDFSKKAALMGSDRNHDDL
ncbi:MAG: bifunctional precorrin-2 dehydrogenase/sirohydrochlorin ferrochelatase [Firmicutes bacterium]|nr:bifunctional precorrin-2 dehydrogenase/sirohydrochlorin ferrochelatase [Bacillota bacterium]MCL5039813.1 bifunctional precorrin-2 dehydrogenase/sirohydrochlorin ferrochelatase [Bacillota bacterium]